MSALASGGVDGALRPTSCHTSASLPSPACICPSPFPLHVTRTPSHATNPPFYGMYPSVCTLVELFHLYIPPPALFIPFAPPCITRCLLLRVRILPCPFPPPLLPPASYVFSTLYLSLRPCPCFSFAVHVFGMHVKQLCHQPAQLSNTWEGKVARRLDDAVCMYRRMC